MFNSSIELRIPIDKVDGCHVMGDQRQNLLFSLLIHNMHSIGIIVVWNALSNVPPNQRIRLNVQRTSVLLLESRGALWPTIFRIRLFGVFLMWMVIVEMIMNKGGVVWLVARFWLKLFFHAVLDLVHPFGHFLSQTAAV